MEEALKVLRNKLSDLGEHLSFAEMDYDNLEVALVNKKEEIDKIKRKRDQIHEGILLLEKEKVNG